MRASQARFRAVLCAALLGCLTLTACGADEPSEPPTADTASSSDTSATTTAKASAPAAPSAPTSTPPATPTRTGPPPLPQEPTSARSQTPQGATIFINHYVALLNRAYQVGTSKDLAVYEGPECGACEAQATAIAALAKKGQRASGPAYTTEVAAPAKATAAPYVVPVTLTRAATPLLDKAGATVGTLSAATTKHNFVLTWTGMGWQVDDIRKAG